MAQSLWLSKRAVFLQDVSFNVAEPTCLDEKQLALYIRYQTTNDRAFHKCLDQLLKLRAEKRKQEIGFESQERKRKEEARRQEEDVRKEADEVRKQTMHEARVRAVNAKAADLELDTDIRETVECRLPGHTAFPFKMLKGVLKMSLEEVAADLLAKNPAEAA
jgi:low affinity Fe/Cu permease